MQSSILMAPHLQQQNWVPESGTAPVEQALQIMRRHVPAHRLLVRDRSATALAASKFGFDVGFESSGAGCIVFLDGWHDEFANPDQGLRLIQQALTGDLRLKVEAISGRPWMWTVERLGPGSTWAVVHAGGLFRWKLGRTVECRYLRN